MLDCPIDGRRESQPGPLTHGLAMLGTLRGKVGCRASPIVADPPDDLVVETAFVLRDRLQRDTFHELVRLRIAQA